MRRIIIGVLCLSGLVFNSFASEGHMEGDKSGASLKSRLHKKNPTGKYGKGAWSSQAIPISKVMENPDQYVGKEITVSGPVSAVCPKAGCWLKLDGDKKTQSMRIKVRDGQIVFPLSAKGKIATTRGTLQEIKMTRDKAMGNLGHLAMEQKLPFDKETASYILANLRAPIVLYQIFATGAKIE